MLMLDNPVAPHLPKAHREPPRGLRRRGAAKQSVDEEVVRMRTGNVEAS